MEPMTDEERTGLGELFFRRLRNIYGITRGTIGEDQFPVIANGLFVDEDFKPGTRLAIGEWIFLVLQGLEALQESESFELKRRGEVWRKKVMKYSDVRILPDMTQEKLMKLGFNRLCK